LLSFSRSLGRELFASPRQDSLRADAARADGQHIVISADSHEAVLTPVASPTVLDEPELFACFVQAVNAETDDCNGMVRRLLL